MVTLVNPSLFNPYPTKAIEPPIWCLYLASHLRDIGLEVKLVDMEADNLTVPEALGQIEGQAILVAMGTNPSASSTPKMAVIEQMMNGKTQVAGIHPQAVSHPRLFPMPSPKELAKLTPAWDLVDLSKYKAHNWHCFGKSRDNYGVLYTSFGCPYNCYYCNIHTLYKGRRITRRKNISEEIDILAKKGMKNLKICDELFTLYPKHVSTVCDALSQYDFNVWAYARVNTVNPKILDEMKGAGINWLAYGFESSSDEVRNRSNKNYRDPEEAIKMTRQAGISIIGNFIFGLPGDTVQTMESTLEWAEKQNFKYVNFYVGLPYPGSEWYRDTRPRKWETYNQFSDNVCVKPKIARFRNQAFIHYFSRPEYMEMIENKFGVSEEIREMLYGDKVKS